MKSLTNNNLYAQSGRGRQSINFARGGRRALMTLGGCLLMIVAASTAHAHVGANSPDETHGIKGLECERVEYGNIICVYHSGPSKCIILPENENKPIKCIGDERYE